MLKKINFNDIDPTILAPKPESVWDHILIHQGNVMSKTKKYRLKKWYPSLPEWFEDGDIVTESTDPNANEYGILKEGPIRSHVLSSREIENNPDFWEKVEEKDYEILSFEDVRDNDQGLVMLRADGKYWFPDDNIHDGVTEQQMLHEGACVDSGDFIIYSVRRKSDGEVFTVGNKVKHWVSSLTGYNKWSISSFKIKDNKILAYCGTGFHVELSEISKRKEPLSQYKVLKVKGPKKEGGYIYARNVDGSFSPFSNTFSLEWALENGYSIHSVKRLSDGEVFTIGDKVKGRISSATFIINEFELIIGDIIAFAKGTPRVPNFYLKNLEHIREPLLTTEDGVDIYDGDRFYYISMEPNWSDPIKTWVAQEKDSVNYSKARVTFKDINKAVRWVKENSPIYSKKDIKEAMRKYLNNQTRWADWIVDNIHSELLKFLKNE